MTYDTTILADSPIAYWRLGEPSGTTAVDTVGSSSGTYNNTPTLAAASLISNDATNTCVGFSKASNEYVEVIDNATISAATGSGPCSWEFWTQLISDSDGDWIGKFNNIHISRAATTGLISVHDYSGGQGVISTVGFTDTTTAHHIVTTKDGSGNWKLYLDGSDVTGTTTVEQLTDNASSITIGRGSNFGAIDAYMDEVAAYDKVLTSGKVAIHYNAAFSGGGGGGSTKKQLLLLGVG